MQFMYLMMDCASSGISTKYWHVSSRVLSTDFKNSGVSRYKKMRSEMCKWLRQSIMRSASSP